MKQSEYFESKEVEDLETRFKLFIAKLGATSKLEALNPDDPHYWEKYSNILKSIKNDTKK